MAARSELPLPSADPWLALPGWRRASFALGLLARLDPKRQAIDPPRTAQARERRRQSMQEDRALLALLFLVDPDLPAEIVAFRDRAP